MWWQKQRTYSKVALEDVRVLVNKGRWMLAHRIVRNPNFELQHTHTAHFWFLRMLLELLRGHAYGAIHALKRAKQCSDYTPEMAGDTLRDQALYAIRKQQLRIAARLIEQARPLHKGENREAVLRMTEARLAQANGELNKALKFYKKANELWVELGKRGEEYDIQWAKNNRFHWFRCCALAGEPTKDKARIIITTDPSRPRRWRVRFICAFGLLGARIDNWLF